jgi:hypothetical protein
MAGKPDDGGSDLLYGLGPTDDQIERINDTRWKRDMQAALERWQRDGDLTAYQEAIYLCRRILPRELVEASTVVVERARREWGIARERWEALVDLRERRHELH